MAGRNCVRLRRWRVGDGQMRFHMSDQRTNQCMVDNGEFKALATKGRYQHAVISSLSIKHLVVLHASIEWRKRTCSVHFEQFTADSGMQSGNNFSAEKSP